MTPGMWVPGALTPFHSPRATAGSNRTARTLASGTSSRLRMAHNRSSPLTLSLSLSPLIERSTTAPSPLRLRLIVTSCRHGEQVQAARLGQCTAPVSTARHLASERPQKSQFLICKDCSAVDPPSVHLDHVRVVEEQRQPVEPSLAVIQHPRQAA